MSAQTALVYTMSADLANRVTEYLENKPYKVSKPIMDGIREVKAENGETVYQMDVNLVIHLLDQVMLSEENIRTFMFLRVGYDNLMRRASTTPTTPTTPTMPDNIEMPTTPDTIETPETPTTPDTIETPATPAE